MYSILFTVHLYHNNNIINYKHWVDFNAMQTASLGEQNKHIKKHK